MVIANPCGLCNKPVGSNHRSIQCDVCNFWVHIKCNNISPSKYDELVNQKENDKEPWICINCINSNLPFGQNSNKIFYLNQNGIATESNLEEIRFSLSRNDKELAKQISNLIIENTDPENENTNFCNFYDVKKFTKSKFNSDSNFSILHLNIASLQFHFDDLIILLQLLDHPFDIIAISETKIQKGTCLIKDINIPNYNYLHTPTESTLYISAKLISKPRTDLDIYQAKDIESSFTELIMPKGKNIIIGCIYKHHTIDQTEFGKMIYVLEKANKENKTVFITGDFKIDLLKINNDNHTNEYFDTHTNPCIK